ncbi:MAG: T9SS type A sorting domain-containing protein, partial [Flavobacteriaceae bacterium]|nr:T9SS type A sorting domain-containing protein [Flavobacteriaceae bacterium]
AEERSGAVYIFNRPGSNWVEKEKLFDAQGSSSDLFGFSLTSGPRLNTDESIAVYAGTLFVGAPGTNSNNKQTGSVYFYTENSLGWNQSLELIETKSEHNDHFGISISCNSSGNLFVGASRVNTDSNLNSGTVYFYETFFGQGNSTSQSFELTVSFINAYDHYGSNISTDDENIIIGSPYADVNGINNSGLVTFFRMTSIIDSTSDLNEVYTLEQNVPNPSINSTVIQYSLKRAGNVKISVYNIMGQLVGVLVDEYKDFGIYRVPFETRLYETGVYVYKIEVNDFTATKKMILGN